MDKSVSNMTNRTELYVTPVVEVRDLYFEAALMAGSGTSGDNEGWDYDDDDLGGNN